MNPPETGNLAPLGRLKSKDKDDHKFLLPPRKRGEELPTRRMWYSKGVLDQGNTPECVGHAARKYLDAGPVINKGGPDQHLLYQLAQMNDEWPGEGYEGTSVRGVMKAMRQLGFCGYYQWAFDVETVVKHVLMTGPMVMGTDWHVDMFTPDRHNYVEPIGEVAGGHSWLIIGVDRYRRHPTTGAIGAARCLNSWGDNWADKGRFWITLADLDKLIRADGEAALGTENKIK